jgi:hypothetical protein
VTAPALRPRPFSLVRLFARRAPGCRARRHGPRALAIGALAFALLTLALAVCAESSRPEWRDPEYGHRLRQIRTWQRERPDRPLVVFVGSSRVQMGVSPADMGFPDAPVSPLGYNLGYRCATPVIAWLQLQRLLDDGVRPAAVVLTVAAVELNLDGPAERQFVGKGARLSDADLRRLGPYTDDAAAFRQAMRAARLDPWSARREAVVSSVLPDWQTPGARLAHEGWEAMDTYGFVPLDAARATADARAAAWRDVQAVFAPTMNAPLPHPFADRVVRDLIARCRAEGVAVAVAWSPESPRYRSLYTPAARAGIAAYSQKLGSELGVPVFADPANLGDDDFADGFHLVSTGAAKYSRWLADAHLRPWLAR